MVTVQTYEGEVHYPKGTRVQFPRANSNVVKVLNSSGKVIAVHQDWKAVSTDESKFKTTMARDAYVARLMATK